MSEPVKVLYVNGGLMDRGGISSVMMNYYLHIDPAAVRIDFCVHGGGEGERDAEILERGGKIYHVAPKSADYFKNVSQLKEVFRSGGFDVVHAHADAGNAHILKLAKQAGVPVRISHCHNTGYTIDNRLRILLNEAQKRAIPRYATQLFACSKEAGEWLYPRGEEFRILKNAIDVKRFVFSDEARERLRAQYRIDSEKLVGCVGRLARQKNYEFLLAVAALLQGRSDIKFLIAGDGELRRQLQEKAQQLGLDEQIIFTGQVTNANEYYSAFDIFAMPSLFEGLPVSALEAQCSGLPCLLSSVISREVEINENVSFLPVDSPEQWADALVSTKGSRIMSGEVSVAAAGYDITRQGAELQEMYVQLSGGRSFTAL